MPRLVQYTCSNCGVAKTETDTWWTLETAANNGWVGGDSGNHLEIHSWDQSVIEEDAGQTLLYCCGEKCLSETMVKLLPTIIPEEPVKEGEWGKTTETEE